MPPPSVDRADLERELGAARRRALVLVPFSPSWDAAMGLVEDLERALWRVDQAGPPDERHDGVGRRAEVAVA